LLFELILIRSSAIAITLIHHFHNIHSVAVDNTKWGEAHSVQAAVVFQIDEDLSGAGVWPGSGKHNCTALIALGDRIIFYFRVFPCGGDSGGGADSELHHKIGNHAEK